MFNIGIVGAENSHTAAIAKVINVDKRLRGVRVTHVWGESAAYARKAAEAGQIPHIVKRPEDLIGQVDAACVDLCLAHPSPEGKAFLGDLRRVFGGQRPKSS